MSKLYNQKRICIAVSAHSVDTHTKPQSTATSYAVSLCSVLANLNFVNLNFSLKA